MKQLPLKSIRWQIQAWYGLLLVTVTASLLVGFYLYERTILLQTMDQRLTAPLISLLPQHIPLPGQTSSPTFSHRSNLDKKLEDKGYYIGIWTPAHVSTYLSAQAPQKILLPEKTEPRPAPQMFGRWNEHNYELVHITPDGYILILGMTGDLIARQLHVFGLELALIGTGVIALGLVGGWWVVHRSLRPLLEIASTAERISSGDRTQRIVLKDAGEEVTRLAAVLNDSFDRMAQSYDQQVRFMADASHELRTPVSVILAQVQIALSRKRDAQAYREALETCLLYTGRMKDLLGDLLDLSHYDSHSPELRRIECDLGEILREAIDFVAPLASERRAIITDSIATIPGLFDPVRLSHAFINLLVNAIKHNPEGCHIHLTLASSEGSAIVTVADSGQGIPAELLPHIFDRFYRVDKSRSRDTGGTGLGLSITKAIVEAHGGTIHVTSEIGRGTTFTIRFSRGS